jgi:hypothetical protein
MVRVNRHHIQKLHYSPRNGKSYFQIGIGPLSTFLKHSFDNDRAVYTYHRPSDGAVLKWFRYHHNIGHCVVTGQDTPYVCALVKQTVRWKGNSYVMTNGFTIVTAYPDASFAH